MAGESDTPGNSLQFGSERQTVKSSSYILGADKHRMTRLRIRTAMSPNHRTKLPLRVMLRHLGLLLGLILFLAGCISRTSSKTSSINRFKRVEVSATELGSRNQSLL